MHPSLLLLPLALAASTGQAPITLDDALAAAAKGNVDLKLLSLIHI